MKHWPLIRHVRWWWLNIQVHRWARMWARHGIGLGFPHETDIAYLDKVWRGEE